MICQKCGKELDDEFQVCPYCGSPIQKDVNNQQNTSYNYGNQQMPQSGSYSYGNQANYAQQPKKKNTIGILSLILGIAGMLLSCVIVGIVPAIAAVVLGIIGISKNNGKGQSIAGIVCGVIGTIIFVIMMSVVGSTDTGSVADTQLQTEIIAESQKESQSQSDDNKPTETKDKDEPKEDTEQSESVEQKPADVPAEKTEKQIRKEFIDSCQKFDYKKIARNPDDYIGQNFKVTVQIFSKSEGGLFTQSYMKAYTDDGSGTYFDKMIYVFDEQDENSKYYVNVLENDIITVYGTFDGMEETKNMLNGEKSKDVALHMKYAKLVSEE